MGALPRCEVRWKLNPQSVLSFNFPRIFRSRGTWTRLVQSRAIDKGCENPESASPDCFSLLPSPSLHVLEIFPCSLRSFSLFLARPRPLPFQVALALKYRARRSWISEAGVSAAKLSCCFVTKSRELPRILRAAIHGASFALFISFDRALRNLTSIGRLPMRDFDWYPLIRLVLVMNQS